MRTIITLLFLLFSYRGICQDPAFVVIDVAGDVIYADNKKALIGSGIQNNDPITVGKNSSITLACKNSGYAHFTKPGRYLANTTTYCRAAPDAALAKLCKFAWHQFTGHEAPDAWRNHLDNVGAASRGGACGAKVDSNISDVSYYNGDFVLACKPTKPGTQLYLKLYKDENSASFMQVPLVNDQYTLSQLKGKLKEHTDYYWNVAPKDEQCAGFNLLHMVTKHERDSVVTSLTKAIGTYITNKAERQYMLGYLLENKHYFADALACYKEAAKQDAGNERYSKTVSQFKERYGMK